MAKRIWHAGNVFPDSLPALEASNLPAPAAEAIYKRQAFRPEEKEVDAIRQIGCRIQNCTEPEYPQALLQIYHCPALLDGRGDAKRAECSEPRRPLWLKGRLESPKNAILSLSRPKSNRTKNLYLLSIGQPKPIDVVFETTGLNSGEVLATLFELERKGIIR
jgi:predicted Rossmann fold nucleotide-binding protein DprA/Smf involved in DNA uptake